MAGVELEPVEGITVASGGVVTDAGVSRGGAARLTASEGRSGATATAGAVSAVGGSVDSVAAEGTLVGGVSTGGGGAGDSVREVSPVVATGAASVDVAAGAVVAAARRAGSAAAGAG